MSFLLEIKLNLFSPALRCTHNVLVKYEYKYMAHKFYEYELVQILQKCTREYASTRVLSTSASCHTHTHARTYTHEFDHHEHGPFQLDRPPCAIKINFLMGIHAWLWYDNIQHTQTVLSFSVNI